VIGLARNTQAVGDAGLEVVKSEKYLLDGWIVGAARKAA